MKLNNRKTSASTFFDPDCIGDFPVGRCANSKGSQYGKSGCRMVARRAPLDLHLGCSQPALK